MIQVVVEKMHIFEKKIPDKLLSFHFDFYEVAYKHIPLSQVLIGLHPNNLCGRVQ